MNISYNAGLASLLKPKVRRQNASVGTLIFLILFGAVFAGAGIFFLQMMRIDPSWTRVTGKVTSASSNISDGSTTYSPVVTYSVNGQTYRVTSSVGSSSYPTIGSQREIGYNPTQPQQAKVVETGGTKLFLYIFPAIGFGLMLLGPFLFIRSWRRGNVIKNLVQAGIKLQGVVSDVKMASSSNTSSGYTIEVSAVDNAGNVRTYVSDSLSGIGGMAMADFRSNPIAIDVYVDPTNPDNYYVDIEDIPNLTPARVVELVKKANQGQSVPGWSESQTLEQPVTAVQNNPIPKP